MYDRNDSVFLQLSKKLKENPSSFIFILGAGMSAPAGLPSWGKLADGLIDVCEKFMALGDSRDAGLLSRLRASNDYWSVFSELKKTLPSPRYERYISEQLSDANRQVPETYELIWNLNVCGIVTFNIDKLILHAFAKTHGRSVDYATRTEIYKYKHFPVSEDKFVFFPHGIISDPSSWVFTEQEKNAAYRDNNFKQIMSNLLNSKNVVIMGFNPMEHNFLSLLSDISIGSRISGQNNYYIGPDLSCEDFDRLGEYGFDCITYTPEDENHSDVADMLRFFTNYVSLDSEYPSVYSGKEYAPRDIPAFENCLSSGVDKLREILNGNISNIIPPNTIPTAEQIENLQDFYKQYAAQLHIAWFVDPNTDSGRQVHGYTLVKSIGKGAFGNVYEAYDQEGKKYALKILLPEVKDKVQYLSCFRRGIRSMNILKNHNISGMVEIHSSYEVPACIIMDYVEGVTLREAIEQKLLLSLEKKLELLSSMASIIHLAHNLQECILHRDLKPENIMLQNFYYEDNDEALDVVILDFDLSWHKGATELTVALGAMSQGFMAPEQAEEIQNETRSTAVDVYSIGMISYYVLTGKNPAPYQHRFKHFQEDLIDDIRQNYNTPWKCLPKLLSDTIIEATMHEQKKRLALDTYISKIKLALNMLLAQELPNTHPLLLYELAVRIDPTGDLSASQFDRKIKLNNAALGKTVELSLQQDNKSVIILVKIQKLRQGNENRNIAKYLQTARDRALHTADKSLFYFSNGEVGLSEVTITLRSKLADSLPLKVIQNLASNISDVRRQLDLQ